jgi:hypothetical protein
MYIKYTEESGNDTHHSSILEAGKFVLDVSPALTSANMETTISWYPKKEERMWINKTRHMADKTGYKGKVMVGVGLLCTMGLQPAGCIMQPTATFINCVFAINIPK